MSNYKEKYIKYKLKYLKMKGGGNPISNTVIKKQRVDSETITISNDKSNFVLDPTKIYSFTNKEVYLKYTSKPNFDMIVKLKLDFNDSIKELKFPSNLKILIFGDKFNQPIGDDNNTDEDEENLTVPKSYLPPKGITNLTFGNDFNQPIFNRNNPNIYFLPEGINNLTFGNTFNQPIFKSVESGITSKKVYYTLPTILESLEFGKDFKQKLYYVNIKPISVFPETLKDLTLFTDSFDTFIYVKDDDEKEDRSPIILLPQNLRKLTIYSNLIKEELDKMNDYLRSHRKLKIIINDNLIL